MYRPCQRDCSNRYLSWVIKTTTADLFVFVLLAAALALHITGGGGVTDRQTALYHCTNTTLSSP